MQPRPSAIRQRIGCLFTLSLVLGLVFAGAGPAEAAHLPGPNASTTTPAARFSRAALLARDHHSGRTIGTGARPAETVLATGVELAPAADTVVAAVEPAQPAVPDPVVALDQPPAPTPSDLAAFAASVTDGYAGVLRGVYVPGVLALRVVHQADAMSFAVSLKPGTATQYSAASAYGVTGLLADNIASGVEFYDLAPGQTVTLVYGDGSLRHYTVNGLYRYQALSPFDPYSNFVDLGTGARLTAGELFNQMYTGGDKVTFQTCIAQDGVLAWGRLFVIATPAQ